MTRAALLMLLTATIATAQDKIIFDTDSGFFGDDGASLVMLLRSPSIQITGVTVVSGNVWSRPGAEYMLRTLHITGHDEIPLYLGADLPLKHRAAMMKQEGKIEFAGAFGETHEVRAIRGRQPEAESAVDFIIRTVEANSGQITFLELGPMTNLALALRKRPQIARKIKRLVFMGGVVGEAGNASKDAEFNFWFDPDAAAEVLASPIREKIMFPLNICNHAVIDKKLFYELTAVKTPVTELIAEDMGHRYPGFARNPKATTLVWDALAAGWLIDPAFVTRHEKMFLKVDTTPGVHYGAVGVQNRYQRTEVILNAEADVMLNLDFPRFFAMYKKLLTAK